MTPLAEWSAHRSDIPDTTQHSQQTSMPPEGLEPQKSQQAWGRRPTRHTAIGNFVIGYLSWRVFLRKHIKMESKCRRLNAVNSHCTAARWRKEAIYIITNRNAWTTHSPVSVVLLLLATGSARPYLWEATHLSIGTTSWISSTKWWPVIYIWYVVLEKPRVLFCFTVKHNFSCLMFLFH